jgi:GlcNAc-P-P-Und epimerase
VNNFCVIGGSGFIGTSLCRRFEEIDNSEFFILDKVISQKYPDKTRVADVRSLEDLRKNLIYGSIVINLAAEHRDDVRPISLYDEVNVGGARNICAIAKEKQIGTILFTSTVAIYGFAPIGTDEQGSIAPFNDYGRTKYEAEKIYKEWQAEDPLNRTLVIIRPTVVFGERNRGNVYNLLKQIASRRFVMVGRGENRKSMAYVENVTAFLEYAIDLSPGLYIYNFIDKPDFTMNSLISTVNRLLNREDNKSLRLPYSVGYAIGILFDLVAMIIKKRFTISSIRVKKFCADSVYNTSIYETGFISPVSLSDAIARTVHYEFFEFHEGEGVFYTE